MPKKQGDAVKPKERAAAGADQTEGKSKKDKKKKAWLRDVRRQYANKLRSEGTPQDEMRDKVKSFLSTNVRPAIAEGKAAAQSQNLTSRQRKEFIESAVRTKLAPASAE